MLSGGSLVSMRSAFSIRISLIKVSPAACRGLMNLCGSCWIVSKDKRMS